MTLHVEPPAADDAGDRAEPPPSTRPRRSEQRRRQKRVRIATLAAYGLSLAVLAASIPVLGWFGARAILDSSDGEVVDPVLDPSEPGYQALVSPSPTLLVLQTDGTGQLVGVVLLALSSEDGDGGSVMLVPPATIADLPDLGPFPIDASFGFSGPDAARSTTEWALGIGIDEAVVVSDDEWAEVVASTGPLTLTNPDDLRDADGEIVFPSGPLELTPDEVPVFAAFLGDDESRLNRMIRQELVWSAWLDQLEADPTAVVFPGEQERGLARFLPRIVAGTHRLETMPVVIDAAASEPGSTSGFEPDAEALAALIVDLVPFPAGTAGGERPLVRVLSGTGDQSAVLPAARRVVAGGGQIVVVGNADSFDYETTQIIYWDDARRDEARAVADALGFGTVTQVDEVDESADVVVVLGRDATL